MRKMTTTMLPLFRCEANGSETCFLVELRGALDSAQAMKVRRGLVPYFQYLPTHRVIASPTLKGGQVQYIGPRLTIETPSSSSTVEILQQTGYPEAQRVEVFRRHVIPIGTDGASYLSEQFDHVTECLYSGLPASFWVKTDIPPVQVIPLLEQGIGVLRRFSKEQNLNFDERQLGHIRRIFMKLGKNPTDVALFQLAQMWSDHCRHLLFNARLKIDGEELPYTLFDLLRAPYHAIKGSDWDNILIGFFDNASATEGFLVPLLVPSKPGQPGPYTVVYVTLHNILSGETHNYPGHVCPYHGATTEILGEVRDQLGTGCGSDLLYAGCGRVLGSMRFKRYRIPGEILPGYDYTYPSDKATPIEIAIKGLQGWQFAANCFGKPCTYGFFNSGAVWVPRRRKGQIVFERRESLKPVCFGVSGGTIRQEHLVKGVPKKGMLIVRIGGPSFPVGFCGGSGSSSVSGTNKAAFDENAIQRGNAEMQRRFYQVLLACIAMGVKTPVVTVHDQGAGGIANVLTELIEKSGGKIFIGSVRRGDPTMSDLKVWVCEYQEGQGLIIRAKDLKRFQEICKRENCPCEVVGEVTGDGKLLVYSEKYRVKYRTKKAPEPLIEFNLADALAKMPPMKLQDRTPRDIVRLPLVLPEDLTLEQAFRLVLRRSEVGSKEWITRGVDGSIGGQVILNQYCGPWALPLNDCSLVALGSDTEHGQAASLGVFPYLTTLNPPAGGRMAIGEMVTNLMGVLIGDFRKIQCICNWMWPANINPPDGEIARLVATAKAVSRLLIKLLIAIIGGKDSSSLATRVNDILIKSLETVVFSSVVPVPDVSRYVTPDLKYPGESVLLHLDIAAGWRRLGGSSFGQCFGQLGQVSPDLNSPSRLKRAFAASQELLQRRLITASHDISNGGLLTTVSEMCFGAGCGVVLNLESALDGTNVFEECFAEELGLVVEVPKKQVLAVDEITRKYRVPSRVIGETTSDTSIVVAVNGEPKLDCPTQDLQREWERTGFEFRKLRVNPECARQEWRNTRVRRQPVYRLTFEPKATPPAILTASRKPRVLVVREQGTNGHEEMIAAWRRVGFEVWEAHMADLLAGRFKSFMRFRGLIFPGGFTYGDVLGAAVGWSMKILRNPRLKQMFDDFFRRQDTFSFGTCNGAQLGLRCGWAPLPNLPKKKQPRFTLIPLGSFNHQWVQLRIDDSPAMMLQGMQDSILGGWVANGEGFFNCDHAPEVFDRVVSEKLVALSYVDSRGRRTKALPYSPSGSFVAGVCDPTGRHLYEMPHVFDRGSLLRLWPYVPPTWQDLEAAPWLRMGQNAYDFAVNS